MNTREKVIHSINAIGPFIHRVWKNQTQKIGDEEALTRRTQAIIDNIKYVMLKKYSREEIKNFTPIDIGCYDGYLTTEIEKINYKFGYFYSIFLLSVHNFYFYLNLIY